LRALKIVLFVTQKYIFSSSVRAGLTPPLVFKIVLLFICCFFFLSACYSRLRRPPQPPSVTGQPSSQSLLGAIEENNARVRSVKGKASIKVVSTRENIRAQCLIFTQRTDKWRLEVLSPMNMPYFLFISNEGKWIHYSFAENRYRRGRNEGNSTLFGLKVKDIGAFLSGQIPLLTYNKEGVRWVKDGENSLVTLITDEGKERIWINPEGNRIVKGEFYDPTGKLKLKVGFKEFQKEEDILFPCQIEISLPEDSTWITLTYKEIQVNPVLESSLFSFIPPPGAEGENFSSEPLIPNP
jgi:outer membrane lipoprotein-sorting protein